MVPEEKMIMLEMSVEEAFRLIMSGGIVTSPSGVTNGGGRPAVTIPATAAAALGGSPAPAG